MGSSWRRKISWFLTFLCLGQWWVNNILKKCWKNTSYFIFELSSSSQCQSSFLRFYYALYCLRLIGIIYVIIFDIRHPTSCLYHLLPVRWNCETVLNLWTAREFKVPYCTTKRFQNSFLAYLLKYFQKHLFDSKCSILNYFLYAILNINHCELFINIYYNKYVVFKCTEIVPIQPSQLPY